MAIVQNTYTGNGSTTLYSLSFLYLDKTDVKVTLNEVLTTAFVFVNESTIQFTTAPGAGVAIRIYRDTDTDQTKATFFAGSAVRASDLNANFIQTLYSVQEMAFRFISKLGDTMQGILNMGGFKITNLGTPSADSDSATKAYVDSLYSFDLDVPGLTRWRKTATAGQTVFSGLGEIGGTLAYTPYRESVFVNGAFQQRNIDYTADTGTSITFIPALLVGDVVEIHCVNNVAGAISDQSSDIYFTQSGAGAAVRTVDSKLKDVVSVKDFGAVGNGVADDTAAIQAALSSGFSVYVPKGIYKITSGLSLTQDAQGLYGDVGGQSKLLVAGNGYDAITITSNYSGVSNLFIYSSSIRTSGAFIALTAATRCNFIKNFTLTNGAVGIKISGNAVITYISQGEILNLAPSTGIGILVSGGNDTFISNILIDCSGAEPRAGLKIEKSNAVWVSDSDVINCGVGLLVEANNTIVNWCFFSQFALDSGSSNGIEIVASNSGIINGLFFDNCWSATNQRGVYVGATTGATTESIHFTDSTFYNNQLQGALVSAAGGGTVKDIEFNNCKVGGNSAQSSGTYAGIDIQNNISKLAVRGCRVGVQAGFVSNFQSQGVLIGSGCNEYIIVNNNLTGNQLGGLFDGSLLTSTSRAVRDNLGHSVSSQGYSTIPNGQNSITISHGLVTTPVFVTATPTNSNLNGLSFWVGSFTSTTFTINTAANVANDVTFGWKADIY